MSEREFDDTDRESAEIDDAGVGRVDVDDVTEPATALEATVPEGIDAATGHRRRGPLGRLYHGETSIDFYGRRWWGLGLSIAAVVITVVALAVSGLNLGIDFKGGVAWEVNSHEITVAQARQVLTDHGLDGNNAKITERTSSSGRRLMLQVGDQPTDIRESVQAGLAELVNQPVEEVAVTSVSATWGKSVTEKAIRALVVFLVLLALYISWKLEWKMAATAIVATLHDVIVSVGIYSVFQWEVTPGTVVAFLTILGFSLYDTIVVFDRVKEVTGRFQGTRTPYSDVVNVSMNQVLMRSLNTNLSTVLPVLSLLILGSEVMGAVALREFALALLVGLITGSYSSVFIAAPLLGMLKEREPRYAPYRNRHATGAELERLVLGGSPIVRRDVRAATAAAGQVAGGDVTTVRSDEPAVLLTHPPRPRKKKRRS